jgi:hypothetical protein
MSPSTAQARQALPVSGPVTDAASDPFDEHRPCRHQVTRQLLGASFTFASDSQALLLLVQAAYAGLPAHRLPGAPAFRIELKLLPAQAHPHTGEPPPVRTQSGGGVLCGIVDANNYVVLSPDQRRALVVVSQDMLAHAYHVRYELIEFAVFVLAARGMGLVPLHGACLGWEGRGVLLLGPSGAGKSTLALHGLLHGLAFVAEDGVFVEPQRMLATGVANYLHLRSESTRPLDAPTRAWIQAAPVIRRRSGVEKFEVDLRGSRARLAPAPLQLVGAVLVSSQVAQDPQQLLQPLPQGQALACLAADQPYAAGQPGWAQLCRRLTRQGVYQLQRGAHPQASVQALLSLLQGAARESAEPSK